MYVVRFRHPPQRIVSGAPSCVLGVPYLDYEIKNPQSCTGDDAPFYLFFSPYLLRIVEKLRTFQESIRKMRLRNGARA